MAPQAPDPASPKHVRFRQTSVLTGPSLVEATFVMTRKTAMAQAGDIVQRLGHRDYEQAELAPQMAEWLSEPVIRVLNEDHKNKVFMWCSQYDQQWLDTIRDANDDLDEYQYISSTEEHPAPETIEERILEKLDALKKELLDAHREGVSTMMAKLELQQPQDQGPTSSPTKRRRVNTRSARNATAEKSEKIRQALRHLVGDNSQLLTNFEEFVGSIDPDMLQSKRKPLWTKDELDSLNKDARAQGVSVIEYKLLDRTLQEMQDADLPIANLAALSRLLVSTEQYTKLSEKFPFPFQCEEE
ncbi:hypothetical protein NW752_005701 [Fusarium irregulare]|uniref:Uncharacterized protein n=1 Tax=Fusarium irregulare TaxID=2494466 RepID=A0A9W8PQ58_9HYPO|nr:hypothetical protein NW766_006233 [Fusarium irregulare]KAJ4018581.1 hypothetical protein NW752_005701 [Fusarium irregulare]